jgi:hypothetical protein
MWDFRLSLARVCAWRGGLFPCRAMSGARSVRDLPFRCRGNAGLRQRGCNGAATGQRTIMVSGNDGFGSLCQSERPRGVTGKIIYGDGHRAAKCFKAGNSEQFSLHGDVCVKEKFFFRAYRYWPLARVTVARSYLRRACQRFLFCSVSYTNTEPLIKNFASESVVGTYRQFPTSRRVLREQGKPLSASNQ